MGVSMESEQQAEQVEPGMVPQTGACWNCGFCGVRPLQTVFYPTYTIYEIDMGLRVAGKVFNLDSDFRHPEEPKPMEPVCIARQYDLMAEIKEWMHVPRPAKSIDRLREMAAIEVLLKGRKCPQWFGYTPTFSPKEHLQRFEMLQLAEMARQSQEANKAIAADSKAIAETLLEVQRETKRIAERSASVAEENKSLVANSLTVMQDSKSLMAESKAITAAMSGAVVAIKESGTKANIWLILLAGLTLLVAIISLVTSLRSSRPIVIQQPPAIQQPAQEQGPAVQEKQPK
jgi:hypothetical protein